MFKIKLNPFDNVVAGQTAVMARASKVLGQMVHAIFLELGGTFTQAQCDNIRVIANGKNIVNVTGAHLDAMNNYDRLKDTATFLAIWFADPTCQDPVQAQLGSLDTSRGIDELSVEVDVNSGATGPTLKGFALAGPPSPKGDRFASAFKSINKSVFTAGAAAQYSLPTPLGSRGGAFLRRAFVHHTNLTRLNVKRGQVDLLEDLTVAEIAYMNEQRWRTAQSGLCVFDPISMENIAESVVPTLDEKGNRAAIDVLGTFSGADTATVYSELLAPIGVL